MNGDLLKSHPVGYILREDFPERWVRFHSLPFSVRYPKTELEMQTVLKRFGVVATKMFGQDEMTVTSSFPLSYFRGRRKIKKRWKATVQVPLGLMPAHVWSADADDDHPYFWRAFIAPVAWDRDLFENGLKDIALDEGMPLLLSNEDGSRAMSPYDGGFDCFVADAKLRKQLRLEHAAWLSSHPAGL